MSTSVRKRRDETNQQKQKLRACFVWVMTAITLILSFGNSTLVDTTIESRPSTSSSNDNKLLCRVNHMNSPWSKLSSAEWNRHIRAFFLIWKRSPDRDNEGGGGF